MPELTSDLPKRYYYSDLIIHLEDDFYASHNIEKRIVYLIFAGCVAAIILCIQIYQYFELRRILNQLSAENNVETPEYISGYIADLKATLNIHTKVSLVFSPYIEVPSVIGLARSVIYIPESYLARFSSESIKIIIMHEMIHVKHRDLRVKFLALFAIALNWFNPLCYCLFYEICNISEIYCDEAMIHNKEQDFISRYGNLLINISEEERSKMKNRFISRLVNNGGSILKKRILEMKTKRKRTLKKLSVLVGMLICTVGTSTVFAYDNKQRLFLNSANILIPKLEGYTIKEVMAFLNSELFEYIYLKKFNEIKILKGNLMELPFPDKPGHILTNENIFEIFNLTPDEINHIKSELLRYN